MKSFQATVTSKGQVTLPVRLRSALGLRTGDKVVFRRTETGDFQVEARTKTLADLIGVVKALPKELTGRRIDDLIEESRGARWDRFERR